MTKFSKVLDIEIDESGYFYTCSKRKYIKIYSKLYQIRIIFINKVTHGHSILRENKTFFLIDERKLPKVPIDFGKWDKLKVSWNLYDVERIFFFVDKNSINIFKKRSNRGESYIYIYCIFHRSRVLELIINVPIYTLLCIAVHIENFFIFSYSSQLVYALKYI